MVFAFPNLSRRFRNTDSIVKANKSNIVPELHSKYSEDYMSLKIHNVLSSKIPWQEFPSPLRRMTAYGKMDTKSLQSTIIDKILVLCVDFSDKPAQLSVETIWSRFFEDYGNSLKEYYKEISHNRYVPLGEAYGWYRAPNPSKFYTNDNNGFGDYPNNAQRLVEDTVTLALQDPNINWESFDTNGNGYIDNIFVVHSGAEAAWTGDLNDFWAHVWITKDPIQIQIPGNPQGVIVWVYATTSEYLGKPTDPQIIGGDCHEFAHLLGVPDLYDYTDQSNGVGAYSLMGVGSWGNNGMTPTHMDAWSKYVLGFVDADENPTGTTYLDSIDISPRIFKYTTYDPKQYFLIEFRRKKFYDNYLPSEGLFIWRINENQLDNQKFNDDKSCYMVGLVQADNLQDLENRANNGDVGDPYPGSMNNRSFGASTLPSSILCSGKIQSLLISNISDVAKTMTFNSSQQ